jgi:hypothetical protein
VLAGPAAAAVAAALVAICLASFCVAWFRVTSSFLAELAVMAEAWTLSTGKLWGTTAIGELQIRSSNSTTLRRHFLRIHTD